MTVVFKNGKKEEISQAIGKMIADMILSENGAKQWQVFHDENNVVLWMINLSEVAYFKK